MSANKEDCAKRFLAFATERHNIYLRRAAKKPAPWTDDPILRTYKFCNIYRELDTVTVWIRKNIREPFADHPHLWFMLAIARRINWPDTLAELINYRKEAAWPNASTWKPDAMARILDARTARKEQVYTGAYMVTALSGAEHVGKTKTAATVHHSLLPLWEKRRDIEPRLHGTLQGAFEAIKGQGFAWGGFMTYEVVTDMRHTRYLRKASDKLTWANAGPGALRGLSRMGYGSPPATRRANAAVTGDAHNRLAPDEACGAMKSLLQWVNPRLLATMPAWEMREVEHTLCEFDKYERVRTGEGKPRSKFTPSR